MFFKKKEKELKEAPLYYWEEKSYMSVVLKDEETDILKDSLDRIKKISGLKILESKFSIENGAINLKVSYYDIGYEVGIFGGEINIPQYYLNSNMLFKDEEKKAILAARKSVTIFMKFGTDALNAYHLQIKLAAALVPDMLGLLDESAEKVLPAKWVLMAAGSKVLPNPIELFSVQAVSLDNGEVWLHTHGLCRCGIAELEILQSNTKNYEEHYNLISSYAVYLLDKHRKQEKIVGGVYIGILINNNPIVVTSISWTKALSLYEKLALGGLADRKNNHNSRSEVIFLYKSEEDEKNNVLSKVNIYDEWWGKNPIFFISDEETARMKLLAIERFAYLQEAFLDKENKVLLKIGVPLEQKGKFEHIWFELLEIKGKKFRAKLTQEPYNIPNMHTGDEATYTIDDITDWIVYTKEFRVTPDTAFLLQR